MIDRIDSTGTAYRADNNERIKEYAFERARSNRRVEEAKRQSLDSVEISHRTEEVQETDVEDRQVEAVDQQTQEIAAKGWYTHGYASAYRELES